MALASTSVGEFDLTIPLYEECLKLARSVSDKLLPAICLHNLGEIALHSGDLNTASRQLKDSLILFQELEHIPLCKRTEILLGEVAAVQRDYATALELQRESLEGLREINDASGVISALEAIARTEAMRPQSRRAILLAAGLDKIHEDRGLILAPFIRRWGNRWLSIAEGSLSDKEIRRLTAEGRNMPLEELIKLAFNEE